MVIDWKAILLQLLLTVVPVAAGWLAAELALFRTWLQNLGGFLGTVASALVAAVVAFGATWLMQHFPGLVVPPDLTGFTAEVIIGILAGVLKAWLGLSTQLVALRRARGMKI